jgi:agmatinase
LESLVKPTLQPFVDSTTSMEDARYVIMGAPLDLTASYRSGTRFAPEAIRQSSQYMETFSQRTGLDLEDVTLADIGNIDITDDVETSLRKISEAIGLVHGYGKIPVLLGGEHTVTLGALRALKPELVIVFDAHLDLRDSLMGLKLSHATYMRRALEETGFKLMILGSRAVSREELEFAEASKDRVMVVTPKDIAQGMDRVEEILGGWLDSASSMYLSIDMDVLDPASAPAVGNPSPEGISVSQLLDTVAFAAGPRLMGFDLTEVTPQYDSGLTAIQAAYIVLETIYLVESSTRGY